MSQSSVQPRVSAPVLSWLLIVLALCSLVWLGFATVAFSTVAVDELLFLLLAFIGVVLAVAWVVLTCVSLHIVGPGRARPGWKTVLMWAVTPIAGMLGLLGYAVDWDLMLRLKLSERALVAEAQQIQGGQAFGTDDRWVGLFKVRWAALNPDGSVRFVTDLPWMFDEAGLYYDPGGVVTATRAWPEDRTRLYGPWRRFHFRD